MPYILNEEEMKLYRLAKKHFIDCDRCLGVSVYIQPQRLCSRPIRFKTKSKCEECGGTGYIVNPQNTDPSAS